jgi:hypothetical protein
MLICTHQALIDAVASLCVIKAWSASFGRFGKVQEGGDCMTFQELTEHLKDHSSEWIGDAEVMVSAGNAMAVPVLAAEIIGGKLYLITDDSELPY